MLTRCCRSWAPRTSHGEAGSCGHPSISAWPGLRGSWSRSSRVSHMKSRVTLGPLRTESWSTYCWETNALQASRRRCDWPVGSRRGGTAALKSSQGRSVRPRGHINLKEPSWTGHAGACGMATRRSLSLTRTPVWHRWQTKLVTTRTVHLAHCWQRGRGRDHTIGACWRSRLYLTVGSHLWPRCIPCCFWLLTR